MTDAAFDDWLDLDSDDQCEWAAKYLRRKGYSIDHAQRQALMTAYLNWLSRSTIRDNRFAKIKAAWSTHKSRKKDPKVSFSVLLKKGSKTKLYALANSWGMSVREVLDEMVDVFSRAESQLKNEEKIRRDVLSRSKKMRKSVAARLKLKPSAESDADSLRKQIETLESQLDQLRYDYCCFEVMLEDNGLKFDDLREDQADKATERFQQKEKERFGLVGGE